MRELTPGILLTVVLLAVTVFGFFEAIYLGEQARRFGSQTIRKWERSVVTVTVLAAVLALVILFHIFGPKA